MSLLDALSGLQYVLLGVAVLFATFLFRRKSQPKNGSAERDPVREVQQELHLAERSSSAMLGNLEVRLYDYAREVEGRIQTRLAMLDQLILDADREIARLQELLPESQRVDCGIAPLAAPEMTFGPAAISLRPDFDHLVQQLAAAGLTPEQIGRRVGQPVDAIRRRLSLNNGGERSEAIDAA